MNLTVQKAYNEILRRQDKLEAAFEAIKQIVDSEFKDSNIQISALKKWGRISRDMDSGKGTFFNSTHEARKWLKNL